MTILNKDKILETAKDFIAEGKYDKAIREYEKILEADPKDMRVKLRIAELFSKRRQVPEAIQAYREVAENYALEGFYLKAVTIYKNILRLNPSLLDVNQSLADLYEKMGLNQDAVHQYEILASVYEQKSQFEAALKTRKKLVELAPQDAGHRIRLAEGFQRESKREEAIEQYEILARQFREQKKEPQRLIDLYERILPYRPKNVEMLSDLVHLHYDKKDYKAALKWLEQNKQASAGNEDLISLQAEMYANLNQLETARGKYQELAEIFLQKGNKEKAFWAYGEILAILPEEVDTLRPLVEALEAGSIHRLIQRAGETREKKAEQAQLEEEAKEKLKEENEKAREAQKAGKEIAPPAVAQKPAMAPKPSAPAAPPKSSTPRPQSAPALLQKAQSALGLAKAYLTTGLENEARQEFIHARDCLKKILAAEPGHTQATKLLEELHRAMPERETAEKKQETLASAGQATDKRPETVDRGPGTVDQKKKKKISFV